MLGELDGAKIMAGGQSLVPMLNMRYAFVDHLVDINRIEGLSGLEFRGDAVRIGAMTRQRDILANEELRRCAPVVAGALRFVGHLHTRNRGTIGGSLAHMDPAAELVNIATLLDATVHVESLGGPRDLAIADFPVAFMTPQIGLDEMIVAVTLRLPAKKHGWAFQEFAQRHGDFAIVAASALVEPGSSARAVADVRLVLSGVDFAPQRLFEAEDLLRSEGRAGIPAAAELAGAIPAMSDAMVSGEYRQHLARVFTRRVLSQAFDRAEGQVAQ